jgi:hypothetical protein
MEKIHTCVVRFETGIMDPFDHRYDRHARVFFEETGIFDRLEVVRVLIGRLEYYREFIFTQPAYEDMWHALVDLALVVVDRLPAGTDVGLCRIDALSVEQMTPSQYLAFEKLMKKVTSLRERKLLHGGLAPEHRLLA